MTGTVTLVGAGPGDGGLLTCRGLEALKKAQVVVYDRLVSPEVLALIPEGTDTIDVGKEADHHPVPQHRINEILVEQAQMGRRVVRLKGGDPFLFGRGGEELEALAQHGIPFSEVPGVTSAIAVPAWAGIPVTHRDCASSLHIITGHRRAGRNPDINFEALVQTGGTLVFLMGVSALGEICQGLLDAGMDPETPAALIERGTNPTQRRIGAPLGQFREVAEQAKAESPAVIVVGRVCSFADSLDWTVRQPLWGKTVLLTRPKGRGRVLSRELKALGARVIERPCITLEPILPCPAMEHALASLSDYEWLAFTSPAGVKWLWECLERMGKDTRTLAGVKLAAIGPGTARALSAHGLKPDYIPEVYDGEHLGKGLAKLAGGKVLLLRAEEGTARLTEELTAGNAVWEDIAVYRTHWKNKHDLMLRAMLEAGEVDWVTFTSASTVKGFVSAVGEDFDFMQVHGACIGAQTAAEAARWGIRTETAGQATAEALVQLIAKGEN